MYVSQIKRGSFFNRIDKYTSDCRHKTIEWNFFWKNRWIRSRFFKLFPSLFIFKYRRQYPLIKSITYHFKFFSKNAMALFPVSTQKIVSIMGTIQCYVDTSMQGECWITRLLRKKPPRKNRNLSSNSKPMD